MVLRDTRLVCIRGACIQGKLKHCTSKSKGWCLGNHGNSRVHSNCQSSIPEYYIAVIYSEGMCEWCFYTPIAEWFSTTLSEPLLKGCGGPAQDEMLPPIQMRMLYDAVKAAGSSSAVWIEFPEGDHMQAYDLCREQYWPAVAAFAESLFSPEGAHLHYSLLHHM